MAYTKDTYKGRFLPTKSWKYLGDPNTIIYRSSYELKFMKWCDLNEAVKRWASEEIVIPYLSPKDNMMHRYFVDFYIEVEDKTGKMKKYLVEVKPYRFTVPPQVPKRKTQRFISEAMQWGVNTAKWDAARRFASQHGWEFILVTEKDLGTTINSNK
jgi:hypothetical protein